MHDILMQEYDAIRKNDRQSFDMALSKKQEQLKKLEVLENELKNETGADLKGFDNSLIEHIIAAVHNESVKLQMQQTWDSFIDTLKKCNNQNRVNSKIIESSRNNIRSLISIITGENSVANVYSAAGKQESSNNNNSLATA